VLLGFLVAVLATVVPYGLEMLALRRTTTSHVAFLMSLSPAIAALAGLVVLGQRMNGWQLVGMAAVICACAGVTRPSKHLNIRTGTRPPSASDVPPAHNQYQEKSIR
jgi:inner membrane transporter RhtA